MEDIPAAEGYRFSKAKVKVLSPLCGGKNWIFDFEKVGTFGDALLLTEKKLSLLYNRRMILGVKDVEVQLS